MLLVTFLITDAADENLEAYVRETLYPMLERLPSGEQPQMLQMLASIAETPRVRYQLQLLFVDEDAMNAAFASVEGRKLSRELMNRSGKGIEMLTAETMT